MIDPRLQAALKLHQSGDLAKASQLYSDVLQAEPKNFDALYLLGFLHLQRGEFASGERLIGRALEINPHSLDALYNRGRALMGLKRHEEALACLNKALALNPKIVEALLIRANVKSALLREQEALADLDRVVALKADLPQAWNNRANSLAALGRLDEAVKSYDRALALEPKNPRLLNHRAITLFELKRYDDAARDFEKLLQAEADFPYARGNLVYSRLHACDWRGLETDHIKLSEELAENKRVLTPIQSTMLSDSPREQLECAQIWVRDQFPPAAQPLWKGERFQHDRIRIAYLSADFHSHATAALMAGVFETHDKTRFDTFAISYGRDDRSPMRRRLQSAFGTFADAGGMTDLQIANALRESEIDIAIDLKGHTQEARTSILSHRPAPVQVQYLGFPGTMGADYIDYALVDETVAPKEHAPFYLEKLIYLPDSYQGNDAKRQISARTPTRNECGLPETGFVFCSFNNSFKIMPEIFAIWMRLLQLIDGSVLWLLEDNVSAACNLKREAEQRKISGDRLVFAPRMNLADHLARHRLADLFLDTLPYNAHTTGSDALWAGIPVLTCLGPTFAGRVGASLLRAASLPELVTQSLADYEKMALELARDPARLAALKAKLAQSRDSCALFDTMRFTRNLESAYATMHARALKGEPPQSFAVEPGLP